MSGKLHAPGHFIPREEILVAHWMGDCVSPASVLGNGVERHPLFLPGMELKSLGRPVYGLVWLRGAPEYVGKIFFCVIQTYKRNYISVPPTPDVRTFIIMLHCFTNVFYVCSTVVVDIHLKFVAI
jgi:hypothetical protein